MYAACNQDSGKRRNATCLLDSFRLAINVAHLTVHCQAASLLFVGEWAPCRSRHPIITALPPRRVSATGPPTTTIVMGAQLGSWVVADLQR